VAVTAPVNRFAERKAVASEIEASVLRAVTYASLFQYPLTASEVRRTLVRCRMTEAAIITLFQSSRYLRARLAYHGGFFVPAGCEAWVAERANRAARSRRVIQAHRRYLDVLCALPFIRLVAISGSVAHLNATGSADLDLFVITRGRRVWLIATAMVVIAKLMGCRKTVCANFVMADRDLAVAPADEFSANQIIHLRPVTGGDAYRTLLDANPFVRAMYPNFDPEEEAVPLFRPRAGAATLRRVLAIVGAVPAAGLERVCRWAYGAHLRRRLKTWASPGQVRLTPTQLKLHGNSHRAAIAERFEQAVRAAERAGAERQEPIPLSSRCFAR
jgi:hypothetical protein